MLRELSVDAIKRAAKRHQAQALRQATFKVVGLAASAGGLAAITAVLSRLPSDFQAGIVVVQHLDPRRASLMASILDRRTALRVKQARQRDRLSVGRVFIAPPNRHLLIGAEGALMLTDTKLVHFVRPSADLLFESLAALCKEQAVAVVLSGSGSDGSLGVIAIKKMNGAVIAQDERSSEFYGMPGAAIRTGAVDLVLPLDEIAPALIRLVEKGSGA
jgi:two-component system chemotaxis response regulator CheB